MFNNFLLSKSCRPAGFALATTVVMQISSFDNTRTYAFADDDKIMLLSKRFRRMLNPEDRKKQLSFEESKIRRLEQPLRHIRAIDFEVDASITEVEAFWSDQTQRQKWDTQQCAKISSTNQQPGKPPLVHLTAHPTYLLPARDYVFRFLKAPAGLVGLNDFRAVAFFSIDSPNDLPRSWLIVRGNLNSLMLLIPNGSKTSITYIVEFNYNGWVPSGLVDIFADSIVQRTAKAMKTELERSKNDLDLSNLSVEEAAKKVFATKLLEQKKREMESFQLLIDDPKVTKKDLEDRIQLLQKQLGDLSMPEGARSSLEDYLRRTKARLREIDR